MIEIQEQKELTTDYFRFACPECHNNRIFEAIAYRQQLIWVCGCCGNQTKLLAQRLEMMGKAKYLN